MEMTGGEAVAAALETLGVRHEQAAAHAADGYARATGELGVVIAPSVRPTAGLGDRTAC